MPDNMHFGGGADASSMTPVVLVITLLAVLLVLVLPRRFVVVPILPAVFLTPVGQQLMAAGTHFFVIRLLILAGAVRMLASKGLSRGSLFGAGGLNRYDKLFFIWVLVRGLVFILLFREGGAVVYQVGLWLDALGGYLLFRFSLHDQEDILRAIKVFVPIAAVLAICMSYEYLTRVNVFSHLAGREIVPWLREGRVRAQAVFGNSITAGAVGATLLPLFFWLWKSGRAKSWGLVGLISASVVAVTSMASTPITGYVAGVLALCLWPIRNHMRKVRWALVFALLGLSLVMKAPVWYVITRINVAGGQSWDRAYLIDQSFRHFFDWWLLGTKDNASWGFFTWDQCNQFISEGLQGGAITLILFIALISRGFGMIGRCRKRLEGDLDEWLFWCLGAALFAHVITFIGIDYFDQTKTLWFVFLAMISVATHPLLAGPEAETVGANLSNPRLSRFALESQQLGLANAQPNATRLRSEPLRRSAGREPVSQSPGRELFRDSGFRKK